MAQAGSGQPRATTLRAPGDRRLDAAGRELNSRPSDQALAFYTRVLGFVKKAEVPLGTARWLTVVSPDEPDGPELVLEPADHPAVAPYRAALVHDGIPATSFAVQNIADECARLKQAGVTFTQEPVTMGLVTPAVFDDTCGNLIQIAQRV